ncbi:MAG: SAM-dependent chlorinase/fluorinase [Bacteroidota bacterium]|jgi:S-adenosylmethionine hydrolase|nr:SAM-dependent chlorinase/fluorinase [Bacteroidota bacterium]
MSIVTLSSDIGIQDYIIGAIKGQIISACSNVQIVDVNHDLTPHNYPQAAYFCNQAFKYFPKKSIHIILLDCFEGNNEQFLISELNDQIVICPDNGLLTMLLGKKQLPVFSILLPSTQNILEITSVLANLIGQLDSKIPIAQVSQPAISIQQKIALQPSIGNDWIEGQVLFIDKFDNVIINITQQQFEEAAANRTFEINIPNNAGIYKISKNYADVPKGEVLAIFNAAGYLELAVNNGKMAALFGLRSFSTQKSTMSNLQANALFYQAIRIYFLNQ